MIYRRGQKVLIQGMTGKQGSFWSERMMEMGTTVIGGVNPKRAGETHLGLPIFKTAVEAAKHSPVDVSVIFIPPTMAKEAIIDAIDAGIGTIVTLTEHIPSHDVLEIFARQRVSKSRIIGPNTAGIVTPGEGFVGIMPGHNPNIFKPGNVGVISRSGSLGTLMCLNLTRAGLGQSAFIGIGGDPIIGTTTLDALQELDRDDRTTSVVLVGEIGGGMEEEAAEYARGMKKPIVSFIAGRSSPPDKKMGHAGAIVTGGKGGYATKREALEKAGVRVAGTPAQAVELLGVKRAVAAA
ncbi:MAG: succinate--CoA ligase subunit alpha [Xanthobacteraceae bacterium]|nr:succinate--CoA ligase subunit alpha [Xanthobacteraceae bacterium]